MQLDRDYIDDLLFLDFDYEFNENITIGDMIKGYNIVREVANEKLKTYKKEIVIKKISDVMIIKKESFWINRFICEGIKKDKAELILSKLVFNASRDLLDCPFYKIGNYYFLLPSIGNKINPSKSMLSNFNSREVNVSFKGDIFEDHLEKVISKAKCKKIKNHKIIDNEEYECDLIFELNGHVIFVEAKCLSPVATFNDYVKNESVLRNATCQLNRITNYIMDNDNIKSELGINEVKSITKMVVSNIPLGSNKKINDVYITDEVYFTGFMERNAPALYQINHKNKVIKTYKLYNEFYDGEISINKFLELIDTDPLKKSIINNRIETFKYNDDHYNILHKYYMEGRPSTVIGDNFDLKNFV